MENFPADPIRLRIRQEPAMRFQEIEPVVQSDGGSCRLDAFCEAGSASQIQILVLRR